MTAYPVHRPLCFRQPLPCKERLKLFLGGLLYRRQTLRWHAFLGSDPVTAALAESYVSLAHKVYRPYFSTTLDCGGRVDLLIGHYRLLLARGMGPWLLSAASRPALIASLTARQGAPIQLYLLAINGGHREGDLTLQMHMRNRLLYSASFSFACGADGGIAVALGSLQGANTPDAAALVREATRELHGCRPKTVLLTVLRALGATFGASTVQLVSNRNRISVNLLRQRRITADYDASWREMGARPRPDGNFELACTPDAPPDWRDRPSNKRAAFRRRQAMLDSVCRELPAVFAAFAAPAGGAAAE
jgi:uncharacterized protein VirK/YbjX